jgi:hypothetical protein
MTKTEQQKYVDILIERCIQADETYFRQEIWKMAQDMRY